MHLKNITLGADPELFFENNKTKELKSVEGLIGGSKDVPLPINKEGCFIQEDNIMAEFNIPPCKTITDFIDNIFFVKEYLSNIANKNGCILSSKTSGTLSPKELKTKQALIFGCDPDYNVYLREVNAPIVPNTTFRSCGGHIHIGWDNSNLTDAETVVKALDLFLGLESVILDKDIDRRDTYGKAGNFRLKSYGVEYRTLSNFWIQSPSLTAWAFKTTLKAIEAINNGTILPLFSKYSDEAVNIINNSEVENAKKLLTKVHEHTIIKLKKVTI